MSEKISNFNEELFLLLDLYIFYFLSTNFNVMKRIYYYYRMWFSPRASAQQKRNLLCEEMWETEKLRNLRYDDDTTRYTSPTVNFKYINSIKKIVFRRMLYDDLCIKLERGDHNRLLFSQSKTFTFSSVMTEKKPWKNMLSINGKRKYQQWIKRTSGRKNRPICCLLLDGSKFSK